MDLEDVKEQCSQDWQQVKKLHAELQSAVSKPVVITEPLLPVLEETEKRLKAELQGIRERELSTIPQNPELQKIVLKQAEQQSLQEYKETVAFLRATRTDAVESLNKSEAEFAHLQQINEEMKKELLAFQETEQEQRENSSLEALQLNARDVSKTSVDEYEFSASKILSVTMSHFHKLEINQKCPPPEPGQVRRTLNESQDVDPNQIMDMKRMLGRLIEQSLNSPEQPYVDLDHRFWPAQVEFLLQCQLIVQHPDNPRKIKLVPFHL
ncbi:centromere protein K-like [Elysia marginata]|uniref:Centromere protein K-like n=1 Tax=Elysia marginata TaxID=1093978 RepID=A0AAV4F0C1_9GAST|nr:centromere protein K-like [Elysia marginata]